MPRALNNSIAFHESSLKHLFVKGCESEHRANRIRTQRQSNPNTERSESEHRAKSNPVDLPDAVRLAKFIDFYKKLADACV